MTCSDSRARQLPWVCLCLCLLVPLGAGSTIAYGEAETRPSELPAVGLKSPARYCGLFCLYSIIKTATSKKISFEELIKPEYVGSYLGSSLAELQKAAEDYGLYTIPASKMTSRMLRVCPGLVILHVKSDLTVAGYDHYQLFLGSELGRAKLFDPPNPVKRVPFEELATYWDGKGLIVSTQPIDPSPIFASARRRFVVCAAALIIVVGFVHFVRRQLPRTNHNSRRRLLGISAGHAAGLVIAAVLCAMIYHFANNEGLLANANGTASIQEAHAGNFIPKISERKVHRLLDSAAVFIDARFVPDFEAGHLEGAISVPVDANDAERRKATAHISKDTRIVLYCQSVGCKFAETVAIKLMEDGFSNVSIFRGGWAEWLAKNGRLKEAAL